MGRRNALALESSMLMEYSVDIRPQYSLKAEVSGGDTLLNVFPVGQVAIKRNNRSEPQTEEFQPIKVHFATERETCLV